MNFLSQRCVFFEGKERFMKNDTPVSSGNREFLEQYIPLLDFFAEVCGPEYELVLHDVSRPESSIVAIRNGQISGRTVGSTMSEYAPTFIKLIQSGGYAEDMVAHVDRTKDNRILESHTFFIKDEKGELRGMICANHDVTSLIKLHDTLHEKIRMLNGLSKDLAERTNEDPPFEAILEKESHSNLNGLMDVLIEQASSEFSVAPPQMSPEERIRFVSMLKTRHLFSMKGAVAKVAERLGVSEATVYRYLKKA
jgi:predicted transcriptional regulator YheO